MNILSSYVILYPLIISIVWILGSIFFNIQQRAVPLFNSHKGKPEELVSVLIPAHNEQETLYTVAESVANMSYKNIEMVMIDDGSSDNTLEIMAKIKAKYQSKFPVIIVPVSPNGGKANALNQGFKASHGKYLLCLDSDCYVGSNALKKMMVRFYDDPKAGAVGGRPVVRNRTTLLGRLELLEYIGIIDIIKRGQAFLTGHITTVSGVIVAYRRAAVKDVGLWNPQALTEDIDITWRLYSHNWHVIYCPSAVSWILVPEHIHALIKQRTRWARGGLEVLFRNRKMLITGRLAEQWLLLDMILSNVWALCCVFAVLYYFFTVIFSGALILDGGVLVVLVFISIIQFILGFFSSQQSGYVDWRDLLLLPLYIIFYWVINLISCITALGSFYLDPKRKGSWESPDRGV